MLQAVFERLYKIEYNEEIGFEVSRQERKDKELLLSLINESGYNNEYTIYCIYRDEILSMIEDSGFTFIEAFKRCEDEMIKETSSFIDYIKYKIEMNIL